MRRPWSPDAAWADPLIAFLALFCLLGSSLALSSRSRAAAPPAHGPTLQGRITTMALGMRLALGSSPTAGAGIKAENFPAPDDRAGLAVVLAELGRMDEARAMIHRDPRPSGEFREAFAAAYEGAFDHPVAIPTELDGLPRQLLQARLAPPAQRAALRSQALKDWTGRFGLLALAGLGMLLLLFGGLATGIWLVASKTPWPQAQPWAMSGRALLLVLLGWFAAYFLWGLGVSLLVRAWGPLRPYALPLASLLHASTGLFLLLRADGLDWAAAKARLFPSKPLRSLALAPPFLGLGFCAVLVAGLLLGPFLKDRPNPQQELLEGLRQLPSGLPVLATFLTVAVVAPIFEEIFMRGLLMGWIRSRKGPALALAVSALAFGAVHLQPLALPTLSLLGAAFGLAVLKTSDLRTAILAHGLWNGSLFLLLRLVG